MPTRRIGDIELYYELQGEGSTPMLFIHGLGSSGRDWERQIPAFAADFRICTVDLRGHGRSQRPPGPYSIAQLAGDLAGLLAALKLAPVHVVGLSLGGTVGLQLAIDHPALVRTLTVVNSGPDLRPKTPAEHRQVRLRVWLIRLLGLRPLGRILGKKLFPNAQNAADRQQFIERFANNTRAPYLAAFAAVMQCDLTTQLGSVRCPTLVVSADHDYWPVSMKQAYVEKMPDARLRVIPDSHHALPVEKPVAFNAVLREFLADPKIQA